MKQLFQAIRERMFARRNRQISPLEEGKALQGADELFQYSPGTRTIFINVFDVGHDDMAKIVAVCSRRHGRRKKLVFLTNSPDFALLRASGHVFEYFPSVSTMLARGGDRDWTRYLLDRMDLLVVKWRPTWRIDYGTRFEDYLAAAGNAIQGSTIPGGGSGRRGNLAHERNDPTVRGA